MCNLESAVLENPKTPNRLKSYVYFTYPESIRALKDVGINYVSLGNNHVYDYLEEGLNKTLYFLSAIGLANSGAGSNIDDASLPSLQKINDNNFALFSFTSVAGTQFDSEYQWVALNDKGGAGDLRDSNYILDLLSKYKDYISIVQVHTGIEYSASLSEYAREKVSALSTANVSLFVGHHTHTAQGVSLINGVPFIQSLGNLVFDSDRQETLFGQMAVILFINNSVSEINILPIYIEDYKPKIIAGNLANRLFREWGNVSDKNILFLNNNGVAKIVFDNKKVIKEEKIIYLDKQIDNSKEGILDLRSIVDSDFSLSDVQVIDGNLDKLYYGQDILYFGDFEDYDLDNQQFENTEWYLGYSNLPFCNSGAHTGISGACVYSNPKSENATLRFRKRIRVIGNAENNPIKDLSFLAYVKGEGAGTMNVNVEYGASEKEVVFSNETIYSELIGDRNWTQITAKLDVPPDMNIDENAVDFNKLYQPRSIYLSIDHSTKGLKDSREGSNLLAIDDIAIISWIKDVNLNAQNPYDYLKITGSPGDYRLKLVFNRYIYSNSNN